MSLLFETESMPSRVQGLFSYLLERTQPIEKANLISALSPQGLGDTQDRAGKTVKQAVELGLIKSDKNECLALHSELLKPSECDRKNHSHTIQMLPSAITRLAFTNPDNKSNSDLGQAIAWVLTKSPLSTPLTWEEADRNLIEISSEKNTHALELNDVRFGNLVHWITYLGFARLEKAGKASAIVADPTVAVRTALKTVLAIEERRGLSIFINDLAKVLPVIDGGTHRLTLLKKHRAIAPCPDGQVSSALSTALLRLQHEGVIKLRFEADASDPKTLVVQDKENKYTSLERLI